MGGPEENQVGHVSEAMKDEEEEAERNRKTEERNLLPFQVRVAMCPYFQLWGQKIVVTHILPPSSSHLSLPPFTSPLLYFSFIFIKY